ncbi:hypothetical protein HOY82DRAFT_602027 [Tuber indicum]|nr:hypothetical protein HOY82DRAFT_602027 [Tuber indicum]
MPDLWLGKDGWVVYTAPRRSIGDEYLGVMENRDLSHGVEIMGSPASESKRAGAVELKVSIGMGGCASGRAKRLYIDFLQVFCIPVALLDISRSYDSNPRQGGLWLALRTEDSRTTPRCRQFERKLLTTHPEFASDTSLQLLLLLRGKRLRITEIPKTMGSVCLTPHWNFLTVREPGGSSRPALDSWEITSPAPNDSKNWESTLYFGDTGNLYENLLGSQLLNNDTPDPLGERVLMVLHLVIYWKSSQGTWSFRFKL